MGVDDFGTPATRDILANQLTFDSGGRKALILQQRRQAEGLLKIALEGTGCLRARPCRAVHIDGMANHDTADPILGDDSSQSLQISSKLPARDRDMRCRYPVARVGKGHADGLGAGVKAKQTRAPGR